QLPTTPGTSGSPLVRCGQVVAVNNAGTVNLVVTLDENGNVIADRQAAAANNFGIHVKHLSNLLEQIDRRQVLSTALPPNDPSYAGSYTCSAIESLFGLFTHDFGVRVTDPSLAGTSYWSNATFSLTGSIDRFGTAGFSDNASQQGFVSTLYLGFFDALEGIAVGVYVESNGGNGIWACAK
ncbi:MAG: hypothetical protein AABZ47_19090, partial [Planctomycetota bacterium]